MDEDTHMMLMQARDLAETAGRMIEMSVRVTSDTDASERLRTTATKLLDKANSLLDQT